MSMMIQFPLKVVPSAASGSQPQALSDEDPSGSQPSFFKVLAKSLLPDTEVARKKAAKVQGAEVQQDKPAVDDKTEAVGLLLAMNLPIVLPERKLGAITAGGATALESDLKALARGGPLLPAAAAERAHIAVSGTGNEKEAAAKLSVDPDMASGQVGAPAAVNVLTADVQNLSQNLSRTSSSASGQAAVPGGKDMAAKLPVDADMALNQAVAADGQLKATYEALAADNSKPVVPTAAPAAINALTAAVQNLSENPSRTPSSASGQAAASGGKEVVAKSPVDPDMVLGQAVAAHARPSAQAGLNAQSGQMGRSADHDAALLQTDSAKAEGQFMATFEALAADSSKPVVPTAVGALMSASMEPVGTSSAAPATLRAYLAPDVGGQGWGKALSQQMINMGKAGHQVTELQLNPPGLGPLKVTLDLNDHQMQLTFVSNHASVRAAVEAAMPQLRATLAENGISLGNTSVSSESQAQAQTAFSQGQGRAPDHRAYPSRQVPENAAALTQFAPAARRSGGGLAVDTYA